MINLINTISIFIFNFLISYITFSRVQNIYPEIILSSLENIRNDLSSIGFPNDVNLNIYFIIFTISLFNTLFWYIFVYRNLKINEATDLLKYFGILFFINLGVSFFFLYFLRFFDISRGVLLLNLLSYPFLLGVLMVGLNYFKNQKEKRRSIVLAFVVSIFVITESFIHLRCVSSPEGVSFHIHSVIK